MLVCTPTADKTMSASTVFSPFFVAMVHTHFSPVVSTWVTEASVITVIFSFLKARSTCFETSSSSFGTTLGRNSTKVTFTPIEVKKKANSDPMAPEPTTTMLSGSLSSTRA